MVHQRASDRDSLLLASGELRRNVVRSLRQAYSRQSFQGPAVTLLCPHTCVNQRELDILHGGRAAQKVECLENETEFLVSEPGELNPGKLRDIGAFQEVRPFRRLVQAADNVHEGGLAGPGGPHDRHELPPVNFNGDPAQSMDPHRPCVVVLVQV